MSLSTISLALSFLLLSQIVISSASYYGSKSEPKKLESENGPKDEVKTDGYGRKVGFAKVKRDDVEYGLKSEQEKTIPYTIGVQGLIYCKVGPNFIPLKGALARITCLTVDNDGYESAPFSILSEPTNSKGYFLAKVSYDKLQSYQNAQDLVSKCNCKAFLEKSPWESCNVATDVNKGTSGAPLSKSYRLIENNHRLYSVDQFVYVPASTSVSNNY